MRADRTFEERILKRADGLIAVSENTRQDAIRVLGLNPERIRMINPGYRRIFRRAAERARQALRPVRGDRRAAQKSGYSAGCLAR